ncbi:M1 family metallopeptidase [Clostridium pasteurianum]|uniref:M1 family metallopeptidase n=1 Tax=Clostridium pasteurianum TaxID=1501 RepID=UPI001FA8FB7C|nr:M1 family metallopeptidase [Clostridium pasteurianum]
MKVPKGKDRLSYYNSSYNFGNWYPIAAEYDDKGWHLDSYYSMGDPFYSTVSDYKVNITVPKDYVVAATGESAREKLKKGLKTYSFSESNVRDFAFTTSNKFKVKEEKVDGINIKCYSLGTDKELSEQMNYATNSIKIFNRFYGKYPYKTYSVAESSFLTGMEYPGIVFISDNPVYKKGGYYEAIVVHETAHQWWYGVIGDDEVNEAWLDESFACYSENIYNESIKNSREYFLQLKDYYYIYSKNNPDKKVMLKPVQDFKDDMEYSILVYYKGAVMLDDFREKVGNENFFKIIQTYYNRYKYKVTRTEDFIKVSNEITGKDWNEYFNKWLKGE